MEFHMGKLKLTLIGTDAQLTQIEDDMSRLQVLFALPAAGLSVVVAVQIVRHIAEQMLEHGLPLGFENEADDEFIQLVCPQLDNLTVIARERSQFPEDSGQTPST